MSQTRTPWASFEKALLQNIRRSNPNAPLSEITAKFNKFNIASYQSHMGRRRTEFAIKNQLKSLKKYDKEISKSRKMPVQTLVVLEDYPKRYAWSVPSMGLSIPLHPLIAEAQLHERYHNNSMTKLNLWASMFASTDVSTLPCADEDKTLLGRYLEYIRGCGII